MAGTAEGCSVKTGLDGEALLLGIVERKRDCCWCGRCKAVRRGGEWGFKEEGEKRKEGDWVVLGCAA